METALTTLFLGTTRGAVFALVAMGLVLVWRGAGIVNFAQMGQAMFTTYFRTWLLVCFSHCAHSRSSPGGLG